jgi:hypothetical protein
MRLIPNNAFDTEILLKNELMNIIIIDNISFHYLSYYYQCHNGKNTFN